MGAEIFDRQLIRRRRLRAIRTGGWRDFLVRRAAESLSAGIVATGRRFDCGVECGGGGAGLSTTPARAVIDRFAGFDGCAGIVPPGGFVADEERLPLAEGRIDLYASLLTLHHVNDIPGALIQIRRALREGGLFVGALFGSGTLEGLRGVFAEAESAVEGGVSPRVSPFADIRDLGGLLQRAGFTGCVADGDEVLVHYGDFYGLLRDVRGMGEGNVLHERRRVPLRRETLERAAALYHDRHALPDGGVWASFCIVHLTGWSPGRG